MRIQNNITALNTHRNYNIANNQVASSAEKLSSGYRINRAGDDAAGLAISEKMRAQIRGLNMASKNSMDAVSLIQTAEGALQSTHDILQRMRELAVQSSSDTNEQVIDRGALQQEFEALKTEINDIAAKTRFNDQNLIDGTFQKFHVNLSGDVAGTAIGSGLAVRVSATGKQYGELTLAVAGTDYTATDTTTGTPAEGAFTKASGTGTKTSVTGVAYTGPATSDFNGNNYQMQVIHQGDNKVVFKILDSEANTVATSGEYDLDTWGATADVSLGDWGTLTFTQASGAEDGADILADLRSAEYSGGTWAISDGETPVVTPAKAATASLTLNGETHSVGLGDTSVTFKNSGVTLYFDGGLRDDDLGTGGNLVGMDDGKIKIDALLGKSLVIQSGANQGDEVSINIDQMNATSLGIGGSSVATRSMASKAITEVNDAINQVSTQRAALGALQNRMEFKIANLDTSAENLQAAESRIRDVDMAKEMTAFSKKNILVQAATAMLAQANSAPQNVLQLLR